MKQMKVVYHLTFLSSFVGNAAARRVGSKNRGNSWRGSSSTSSGGSFNDGVYKGGEEAEKIWHEKGSDCSNCWTFQDDVHSYIDHKYDNNGNWKTKAYIRGVHAGADQVVKKYEKQCVEDTADECTDLGKAASQEIAFEYCPFSATTGFAPEEQPDYKESCREAAYGVCEGAVGDQVNENGCSISTSDLLKLQQKCEGQVDMMTVGSSHVDDDHSDDKSHGKWGDDRYEYAIQTKMPTEYPTKRPTPRPTPRPVEEWGGSWSRGKWGDDGYEYIIQTEMPTEYPTKRPTPQPTPRPTPYPTPRPTPSPVKEWGGSGWKGDDWHGGWGDDGFENVIKTDTPTSSPTKKPTNRPTPRPTQRPTPNPTNRPTQKPSNKPTARPTNSPTKHPIKEWGGSGWNDDGYVAIETDTPTLFPTKEWGGSGGWYESGLEKGTLEAEKIWYESGSDCSNIWTFEDEIVADIKENCAENNSFCRGVHAGADQVVKKYEKQCLEATADECTDLGKAASQEIAFEYCPFSATAGFAPEKQPDYKESCREAAYGVCEGAVGDQVNENGCSISTSDLLKLQQRCEGQVDMMTVGSSDVDDGHSDDDDKWHGSGHDDGVGAIIQTKTPTTSPSYGPTIPRTDDWHGGWKEPIPESSVHRSWNNKRGGKRKKHPNDWN